MSIASDKSFIKELKRHPSQFLIIHYSCQSLYDNDQGLSPRVTAVIVQHYATEQTVSFAFHETAEVLGIKKAEVTERLDDIERALLERFNQFVQEHRSKYWMHWNMRNITYGFELIEHRFKVLTGRNMSTVPIENRVNLNEILKDRYGDGYVADPKLYTLMELNGGKPKLLLSGKEEVEAFQAGEFLRMHNSALAKIAFLSRLVHLLLEGRLRTTAKGLGQAIDRLFDSRVARILGFGGTALGVVASAIAILQALLPHQP